jgi:two-component system sensor histidine kinase BaeS
VARSVPLRHSLLVRLLTTSVLIALGSIVASAWLATQTATRGIQQEQGRVLSKDITIYDALLEYAAEHEQWDGVEALVQRLAAETDRRITLTTTDHHLIVDTADSPGPLSKVTSKQASAVIDPLHVDSYLVSDRGVTQIDPRVLGPYRLSPAQRSGFPRALGEVTACMGGAGGPLAVSYLPNGRPVVTIAGYLDPDQASNYQHIVTTCSKPIAPDADEERALARLNRSIRNCLAAQDLNPIQVGLDFLPVAGFQPSMNEQGCIDYGRREQLTKYVAPPALLFAGTPDTLAGSEFVLTRTNAFRIAGVTALVLLLTVLVTVAVGTRLVRPLRTLADAVRNPNRRPVLGPITRTDEIGYLTNAFRDLFERRQKAEIQRQAMVSDIAHELRTPLNNIRGWLEAAEDGVAGFDRSLTTSLLEEALLMQHVIDDLQDLAEADAGELELHLETVVVADLLAQVASAQRARAEAAGVLLATDVDDGLRAEVDPVRLRQALGNLVSNAIRYSRPGATVTLRARRTGDRLQLAVVDHGSGIAAKELPRVFDRFWRAEKSRSRQTGGSGLGLAIVRQLVRAHGGEVSVRSTPGIETVFSVTLPGSSRGSPPPGTD